MLTLAEINKCLTNGYCKECLVGVSFCSQNLIIYTLINRFCPSNVVLGKCSWNQSDKVFTIFLLRNVSVMSVKRCGLDLPLWTVGKGFTALLSHQIQAETPPHCVLVIHWTTHRKTHQRSGVCVCLLLLAGGCICGSPAEERLNVSTATE